jgi:ubiquinone/menaquinone biosynthesis C-methylase UbiE
MNYQENYNYYTDIMAQWYDQLMLDEEKDIEFYLNEVKRSGGPVLELGSGTGRILVELLKDGLQVDGLDVSHDMLSVCSDKLEQLGLYSKLYHQSIEDIDFEETYQTIFISGGAFQQIADYSAAFHALQRIFKAIKPGGMFILDTYIPWPEIRRTNEGAWYLGRSASIDDQQLVINYSLSFDFMNQVQFGTYRYDLYQSSRLLETQLSQLTVRWYGREEFRRMLKGAGFQDVFIKNYQLIDSHHYSSIYFCKKFN